MPCGMSASRTDREASGRALPKADPANVRMGSADVQFGPEPSRDKVMQLSDRLCEVRP